MVAMQFSDGYVLDSNAKGKIVAEILYAALKTLPDREKTPEVLEYFLIEASKKVKTLKIDPQSPQECRTGYL